MTSWPVTLTSGEVTLRPLRYRDGGAWREVRARNAAWLKPWDATVPPGSQPRPASFSLLVWRMRRAAASGHAYPFVVEVDGRFGGQLGINNVVRGSANFASVGYWIDRELAGRGIIPRALAMAIDHSFFTLGLHRIEVAIRPENSNSLRVVEKLGLHQVGYAPKFLHIDGDWRDHRIFAITIEECPAGILGRLDDGEL